MYVQIALASKFVSPYHHKCAKKYLQSASINTVKLANGIIPVCGFCASLGWLKLVTVSTSEMMPVKI